MDRQSKDQHQYPRHAPQDRNLRASDADRDAVAETLRHQHVEGRLDTDEFAERYGRCLEAKTYAQLDELVQDLPPGPGKAPSASGPHTGPWASGPRGWQGGGDAWGRRGPRRWRLPLPALLPLVALAVLLGLTSAPNLLWALVPLTFFFVVRPLVRAASGRSGARWHGGAWGRCGI